ncbi:hypothetical protein ACIRD6_20345 [Streptomyces sp. NPDC102473]|uniref:hypothetical protein n=1 Tax=Streptomyces sp. NPDC102473 TaxID=3366180 RepID=UPI00382E65CB
MPAETSGPSPAYLALARLGRTDARLALSAADCSALEGPAAAWLARGVGEEYLIRALTAGLPDAIGSPVGFVRRRLRDKIPPGVAAVPAPEAPGTPPPRPMVECVECGAPGRVEALPDGLCRSCRTPAQDAVTEAVPAAATEAATGPPPGRGDVMAYVGTLRELLRLP